MGISTLQSYHGAQIFEALGIHKFRLISTSPVPRSRIQGLTLDDSKRSDRSSPRVVTQLAKCQFKCFDVAVFTQWKQRGENTCSTQKLSACCKQSTRNKDYAQFKQYAAAVDKQGDDAVTLRSQLEFVKNPSGSIPIEQVEPIESIVKRFATGCNVIWFYLHEAHSTLGLR